MWSYEHSIETTANPTAIWRLWADVEGWPSWNTDIAAIEISGPFAVGSEITMTPAGQDPVRLRIAALTEGEQFTDEAVIAGVTLRTTHRVDRLSGDVARILYRMEITGPAADQVGPRLGPAITADFPETMTALAARAALTQG